MTGQSQTLSPSRAESSRPPCLESSSPSYCLTPSEPLKMSSAICAVYRYFLIAYLHKKIIFSIFGATYITISVQLNFRTARNSNWEMTGAVKFGIFCLTVVFIGMHIPEEYTHFHVAVCV